MNRLAPLLLVVVSATACVTGDAVVAACEDAVAAKNALDCADDVQNPAGECGVLNDNPEAQAANPESPAAVRSCAYNPACGYGELLAFYECRADSATCENGEPTFDPACDDEIP